MGNKRMIGADFKKSEVAKYDWGKFGEKCGVWRILVGEFRERKVTFLNFERERERFWAYGRPCRV